MIESLGHHAGFILASYAAAVVVIGGLIARAIIDHRIQKAALAEFEARGVKRRSEVGS